MLQLWHCVNARSFRALWALEELELDYDLRVLPFPPRVFQKDFLDQNPLGTIPLLVDGETRMTESAAIAHYLGRRHGGGRLTCDEAHPEFGAYLNWLHHGEATLTFPQTLVLRYTHFESGERRSPQVAEDYAKWFLARLRTLEPLLGEHAFLAADRFTAADVSVGYALLLAQHLGLDARFTPEVARYWERLQAREGYQAALASQERAAVAQGMSTVHAPDIRPFA